MAEESDQENLLAEWLNGALSDEEKQRLEADGQLDDLKFAVDDLSNWKLPSMKSGLKEVEARIQNQTAKPKSKTVFFRPWLKYAATILLIAAVYFIIDNPFSSKQTLLKTGVGEMISHVLPDQSEAEIDAVSEISYYKKDWKTDRKIDLKGRALFRVEHGSSFQVITTSGTVTVKGTVFEVSQFENQFEVNCYEGKVEVAMADQVEVLEKGEGLVLNEGKVIRIKLKTSSPSWLDKIGDYEQSSLSNVTEDLKRYYDVKIEFPPKFQEREFTGVLPYNDLDQALEVISSVFELNFQKKTDGTIVFN